MTIGQNAAEVRSSTITLKNLICKEVQNCRPNDKAKNISSATSNPPANCEHAKPHQRDYHCSHYCNVKRGIVKCIETSNT